MLIGNTITLDQNNKLIIFCEKKILSFAIALMGINLNFMILSSLGLKALFLILTGMILTIFTTILISKYYKVNNNLSLLLSMGNGVCGSSAISAVGPIINASKIHIGLSIAIVNLLGTAGMFFVPLIAIGLNLNDIDSGILIGNVLQAVGQVTASGFSLNNEVGIAATTVKMGRVMLLTPLIFIILYLYTKQQNNIRETKETKAYKHIPVFIIFFILFSIISSLSLINIEIKEYISYASNLALVISMSAIGLKIRFNSIKQTGFLAFKIASMVFLIQIIYSSCILLVLQ